MLSAIQGLVSSCPQPMADTEQSRLQRPPQDPASLLKWTLEPSSVTRLQSRGSCSPGLWHCEGDAQRTSEGSSAQQGQVGPQAGGNQGHLWSTQQRLTQGGGRDRELLGKQGLRCGWTQWCRLVILALQRPRQEDPCEFEISLDYTARPCLNPQPLNRIEEKVRNNRKGRQGSPRCLVKYSFQRDQAHHFPRARPALGEICLLCAGAVLSLGLYLEHHPWLYCAGFWGGSFWGARSQMEHGYGAWL